MKMQKIRLIVSDLDGCLLDGDGRLPADFGETLKAMREAGVTFAAASGRSVQGMTCLIPPDDDIAMITDNGACGFQGTSRLWADMLPRSVWYPIVVRVRQIPGVVCVGCALDDAWIEQADTLDERTCRELLKYYPSWSDMNYDERQDIQGLLKMALFYDGDIEKDVYPLVQDLESDLLSVRVTAYTWIDLFDARISKGTGVAKLQQALGVTKQETVIFGDYLNDLPMADYAGLSCAPSNAHPLVRERFSQVIGSNREGAVTGKIRELIR